MDVKGNVDRCDHSGREGRSRWILEESRGFKEERKGAQSSGGGGGEYRNLTANEAGVRRVRKSVKFCDAKIDNDTIDSDTIDNDCSLAEVTCGEQHCRTFKCTMLTAWHLKFPRYMKLG